jgi:hypothetical protein
MFFKDSQVLIESLFLFFPVTENKIYGSHKYPDDNFYNGR